MSVYMIPFTDIVIQNNAIQMQDKCSAFLASLFVTTPDVFCSGIVSYVEQTSYCSYVYDQIEVRWGGVGERRRIG